MHVRQEPGLRLHYRSAESPPWLPACSHPACLLCAAALSPQGLTKTPKFAACRCMVNLSFLKG